MGNWDEERCRSDSRSGGEYLGTVLELHYRFLKLKRSMNLTASITLRTIFPSGMDEDLLLQIANLHSSDPASLTSLTPTSLTKRRCLNTYFDLP